MRSTKTLETALEDHVTASKTYWEILADHSLTKIQNMAHVSGYETAGVQYVKIVAVIDSKTTPICRAMNGKVFKVKEFRKQYDKIMAAAEKHDLKAYKAAQPMISGKAMKGEISDEDIKRLGIKLPPYHFRCRTTHVAYFSDPDGIVPKLNSENGGNKAPKLEYSVSESNTAEVNIQNTMKSYFNKYGKETPRGYEKTLITDDFYYDGATNAKGTYYFSQIDFLPFNPAKEINLAFLKIKEGKDLTVMEEEGIRVVWHEICHNKAKEPLVDRKNEFKRKVMETLNEYYARRTYNIYLERLGGRALHQAELIEETNGYQELIQPFTKFMRKHNLDDDENLKEVENILLNKPQDDIKKNFTNWIVKKEKIATMEEKEKLEKELSEFWE